MANILDYLFSGSNLLKWAALSATVLAMTINAHPLHPNGGFSVTVEMMESLRSPFNAALMAKTAAKFGYNLTSDQVYLKHAGNGTVPAHPTVLDIQYLAPVWIGEQLLWLELDTGSSDTWVFSSEDKQAQLAGRRFYVPDNSSTASAIPNSSWTAEYYDGSFATGTLYEDCMDIGGTVVEDQGVGIAVRASDKLLTRPCDGILGLGFSSENDATPKQNTFLDNAIRQGLLPLPVMTIDLYHGAPGTYDFGYINGSKYVGEVVYVPVDESSGDWMVNMTGWSFGEGTSRAESSAGWAALSVVDTGTSLTWLNVNIVRGYWDTVPGSEFSPTLGVYIAPCNETYPDFTFRIGEFNVTVPGSTYKFRAIEHGGTTVCVGGLQSQENLPVNILGDNFLTQVFAVMDMGNPPRVGFAHKAG